MNGALWWSETEQHDMGAEQPWLHAIRRSQKVGWLRQAKCNHASQRKQCKEETDQQAEEKQEIKKEKKRKVNGELRGLVVARWWHRVPSDDSRVSKLTVIWRRASSL